MGMERKKLPNAGIFFMFAAMFLVLGFTISWGFLVIGVIFLLIGLISAGRSRAHFFDEEGEERENKVEQDGG